MQKLSVAIEKLKNLLPTGKEATYFEGGHRLPSDFTQQAYLWLKKKLK